MNNRFFNFGGAIALLLGLWSSFHTHLYPNMGSPVPVASCDGQTFLTLNASGIKTLNAAQLDNGSYDPNGNFLFFKVARLSAGPCGSDSLFRSQLTFCCEDAGDTVSVIFRAYNIAVDTGGVNPSFGLGNFADCVAKIIVGEAIKPTIATLPDITISCEDYNDPGTQIQYPDATDNCCLDTITKSDQNITYDQLCKRGTVRRRFTARDCAGNTATSTQLVTVVNQQNYEVQFPDDKLIIGCTDLTPEALGKPTIFEELCENMSITYLDSVQYNPQSVPCMTIKRTWRVFNWCNYSATLPLQIVPNPAPVPNPLSPINFIGPKVGPQGMATIVKIMPSDTGATDFSNFWSLNSNGYFYQQRIMVYDTMSPILTPNSLTAFCDSSINDPNLWQGGNWFNPANNTNDLFETHAHVSIISVDDCSQGIVSASYSMFLDLDSDGIVESLVESDSPPPAGSIQFNNLNGVGEQRLYDRRITSIENKYIFGLQKIVNNDTTILSAKWHTMAEPNNFLNFQLPYGHHRIVWTVTDRCGNSSQITRNFSISDDCTPPLILCLPSHGIQIPNTGSDTVGIPLNTLFLGASDNITPPAEIEKAIERAPFGNTFPLQPNGVFPQQVVLFGCADIGFREVRLWARDGFGNTSRCSTLVSITDPDEQCPSYSPAVSGTATNLLEEQVPLAFDLYRMTDTTLIASSSNEIHDFYFFNDLTQFGNYFIKPKMDSSNILNGADTYDLILISRHILNFEPLNTPYKIIAADVNHSESVTTFDIVTLRKIILGTLSSFPDNTSWRFVPKNFNFQFWDNPFASVFPEQINLSSIYGNVENADFYAIKIGDVDYSALPVPFTSNGASDRHETEGMQVVLGADVQQKGQVPVYVEATEPLLGYQFALQLHRNDRFWPSENLDEEHFSLNEQQVLSINSENELLPNQGKVLLGWLQSEGYPALTHTPTLTSTSYTQAGQPKAIGIQLEQAAQNTTWMTIYPNPSNDWVHIFVQGHTEEPASVAIHDTNGRLVFGTAFIGSKTQINTTNWPSGCYSITLRTSDGLHTAKLMKL